MKSKKALIIVDLQNDFLPGGALGVKDGNLIIPIINKLQLKFSTVIATRDWHPKNHISFASTHNYKPGDFVFVEGFKQELWPDHCIQNTEGAQFSENFDSSRATFIVSKGVDPFVDSYSAFFDNQRKRSTGLDVFLKEKGIEQLYFSGLTTEFCIRYSVIDAVSLGFDVYVFEDAIKPVSLKPRDEERAILEMKQMGAHFLQTIEFKL
jgi:nicotinamidase/pyrazinamidase